MAGSTSYVCLRDYEEKALSLLDRNTADYYKSGADDEQTLRENLTDYKRFRLKPRMMVDVSNINLKTSLLGEPISFPVCIAPTSYHKLAHPDGEVASVRAAESVGTAFVLSTFATTSAKEISEKVPDGVKWYQLYVTKDRSIAEEMVKRAELYGFQAIVLTVDTPQVAIRRADIRNKFKLPPHLSLKNFEGISTLATVMNKEPEGTNIYRNDLFDQSLTWADVTWLKSITSLPIVVKGVLTEYDAEEAIAAGASAILVSNHGGRQLDGVSSTIMALPEIVKQVRNRVEVYLDGGIRTGTDVLKALALGAKAVFIGRPALYGLAVGGEQGVTHVLEILKTELKLAMQLSGQTDVNSLSDDLVFHESALSRL